MQYNWTSSKVLFELLQLKVYVLMHAQTKECTIQKFMAHKNEWACKLLAGYNQCSLSFCSYGKWSMALVMARIHVSCTKGDVGDLLPVCACILKIAQTCLLSAFGEISLQMKAKTCSQKGCTCRRCRFPGGHISSVTCELKQAEANREEIYSLPVHNIGMILGRGFIQVVCHRWFIDEGICRAKEF